MIILDRQFLKPSKQARVLSILESLAQDDSRSQQQVGEGTSMSVAMVNQYLRELQSQRLVRFEPANGKKYLYKLTKLGERKRVESFNIYSSELVRLYTNLKDSIRVKIAKLQGKDIRKLLLFGASETCEVVLSAIRNEPFEVVAIADNDSAKHGTLLGGHLVVSPSLLNKIYFDAVVITSFGCQDEIAEQLQGMLGQEVEIVRL